MSAINCLKNNNPLSFITVDNIMTTERYMADKGQSSDGEAKYALFKMKVAAHNGTTALTQLLYQGTWLTRILH
jgi:hypothetical protein